MASVRVVEILAGVSESKRVTEAPTRLVFACAAALPVTGVGLMLMTDRGPAGMVAASDGPAATMEELQFTLGEGPCVDCSRSSRPVLQPDLARTGPGLWPAFSSGALDAGIRAIFAFPVQVGGIRLGVLDLYRDVAGELTDDELAEALSFADAATTVLLDLQARDADGAGFESIEALQDRAEVHQATGVAAVHANVSLPEALVLLRARAYASGRPILSVARDVLSGAVRLVDESQKR